VDAILELIPGRVLLVRRKNEPHGWALPGGFVEEHESLEQAVRREVEEETGLRIERAIQMHSYSGPGRDPRFATASTVFVAVAHGDVAAGDDADRAALFPLDALPSDLCFDHGQILEDFRSGRHGIEPGHLH
jgi:8-oxo-dGTP diphosphatase